MKRFQQIANLKIARFTSSKIFLKLGILEQKNILLTSLIYSSVNYVSKKIKNQTIRRTHHLTVTTSGFQRNQS